MPVIRLEQTFPGGGTLPWPPGLPVELPTPLAAELVGTGQAAMVSPPGTVRLEQAFPGGGMIPLAAGVTVLVPQRLADELVGKGQAVVVAEDPDPVLTAITPDAAVIGDPVLTLHCAGSGFSLISVVFFNDAPQPTTFVSPTELTIGVDPATASGPLTVPVHVRNGARESTAFGFTFAEPVEEEL